MLCYDTNDNDSGNDSELWSEIELNSILYKSFAKVTTATSDNIT